MQKTKPIQHEVLIQPQLNYILIFYSKAEMSLILDTYAATTQLYNDVL